MMLKCVFLTAVAGFGLTGAGRAEEETTRAFFAKSCLDCHDADARKGGLDLTALGRDWTDRKNFEMWVRIHDRVESGEMPPRDKDQPDAVEKQAFLKTLAQDLTVSEKAALAQEGRAAQRRMNRYEYENALRDLFAAPWLQIRERLPEDGESWRFNRVGETLDVSHVQMSRYLQAADGVLREVMAPAPVRPATKTVRYHTRDEGSWTGPMKFGEFNRSPERATFPVLGTAPQPEVRAGNAPITVGAADPVLREEEGVAVVASSYEPIQPGWTKFKAPQAGRYLIRIRAQSLWVGPGKGKKWWTPDLDNVSPGRRPEPVSVYAVAPPNLLRKLGNFDAGIEAEPHELEVWLQKGESIRPDAVRLFRSRPPAWQNPLATPEGQPGVSFRWMEVEGPLMETWPPAGHQLLFGDLPIKASGVPELPVEVVSTQPDQDAARLLESFLTKAYRRPAAGQEVARFLPVVQQAMAKGNGFTTALLAGYTAVLCSPEFLYWQEPPGRLTAWDLAERLSSFLTNSMPDERLRHLAAEGRLTDPAVLREETERLLNSPQNARFVEAFLDYWLDLRHLAVTSPDSLLYPDYYLDDYVVESSLQETQRFLQELIAVNAPARSLVSADFVMINERLADLYQIPGVMGSAIRRVPVPAGNPRGGLMTQASVLKVTANGTTTSPVLRGAWIAERLLGETIPPPPPGIPAVEPDIRGAATIRQQLDLHRSQASCAGCHNKIDPAGFALESFDVMGGWRDHYRALGDVPDKTPGFGKNGQRFVFHQGLPVDASGVLPDGKAFDNIASLKQRLLEDERKIARNLARQLTIYATGAPVRFSDRPAVEGLLDAVRNEQYGVRSLIHALIQSPLFLNK